MSMDFQTLILFIILGLAIIAFIREWFPMEVVSFGAMVLLVLFSVVTPKEAVSGFSNSAVITVGALFVLSAALVKTNILNVLVLKLEDIGGARQWLVIGIMLTSVAIVSSFINNVAAMAITLPLAMQLAQRFKLSPSRILLPLSFASMFGGTMTLIGTSTNLLVNDVVIKAGYSALGMFEFTKMGLIFTVVGLIYVFFQAKYFMPNRAIISSLTRKYHMTSYLTEVQISQNSPLVGSTCLAQNVSRRFDIIILEIVRNGEKMSTDLRNRILQVGDMLIVQGKLDDILKMKSELKVSLLTDIKLNDGDLNDAENMVQEVVVSPGSNFIGSSLKYINFRARYGLFVLAIQRASTTLRDKVSHIRLREGDTLLVFGHRSKFNQLRQSQDVFVLDVVPVQLHKMKFWWMPMIILPAIMVVSALEVMDIMSASLVGVSLLLLFRILTPQEMYQSINWSVIFLIATFISVGRGMENTQAADLMATLFQFIGNSVWADWAPYIVLSLILFVTALVTGYLSNNSVAIIMTPIAIATAVGMGVNPRPFIFAVAFAASASFFTPMGYNTNLMVFGPGNYRMSDYFRAGMPLNLLFWILGSLLIPVFWPF
ncbi:MAG: SLC13 family permease [Candidatus Marinimicrobia bacterium]|nr:SLC13 family permease [Candidatus Neomarinimicrobiota bacterium]MCF7840920.1 SLC13 family permease [Candidatus Neomarinimicrobiota bacterium]MCF7902268.1 SLC13 family permease [Candidatus Neomarinimicrobiota bacterium]